MQVISNNKNLRADIQFLRALAVLFVVICHMNSKWLPGGYLGVDMFFVISGYVITLTMPNKMGLSDAWSFWKQRFFRIVPAYVFMLTVVTTCAACIFLPENFSQYTDSWHKSLLFVSNAYFANYGDYFSSGLGEQPLLHTWSLSIEMQFYLLYPLLYVVCMRYSALWLFILICSLGFTFSVWAWYSTKTPAPLYYALYIRAPEFLMGCSLAIFHTQHQGKKLSKFGSCFAWVGLVVIAGSVIFFDAKSFSPVTAGIVCIGVAFVIAGHVQHGVLSNIYKAKSFLLLGALSYSVYLWHWPMLAFARYLLGEVDWTVVSVSIYAVSVLGISWLSWRLIENKFRLRAKQDKTSLFKKFIPLLLIGSAPFAYAKQLNGSVPATPIEMNRYADDKYICHGKLLSSCIRGVQNNPQLLLIGDSHAAQLNLAADFVGEQHHVGVEVITASSCVPLTGFNVKKIPEYAQDACTKQIEVAAKKLQQNKKIVLAAMWSYQFQDETFPSTLKEFFTSAQLRGQSVTVLAQVPKLRSNPRRIQRLQHWGIQLPATINTDWKQANTILSKLTSNQTHVRYIDLTEQALFAAPPFYNNKLIYSDDHHLNEVGSTHYGKLLSDALNPQLNE